MAFRGFYNVEGHGTIPVYDYESEVPSQYKGSKVGIVQTTASSDLINRNNSIYMEEHSPALPTAVFVLIAVVTIAVMVVIVTFLLTATSVTQTETGYYVQVPGAVYWVDPEGNIVSQQGTPTVEAIQTVVVIAIASVLILGGLFITFKYIIPALSKGKALKG